SNLKGGHMMRRHCFLQAFLVITAVLNVFHVFSQDIGGLRNRRPTARAGQDRTVSTHSIATLNGGGSTDADGDSLTYKWTLVSRPEGSLASLESRTHVNPSFEVDVPGSYVLRLIVNDGIMDSAPDTVTFSTSNSRPI